MHCRNENDINGVVTVCDFSDVPQVHRKALVRTGRPTLVGLGLYIIYCTYMQHMV